MRNSSCIIQLTKKTTKLKNSKQTMTHTHIIIFPHQRPKPANHNQNKHTKLTIHILR